MTLAFTELCRRRPPPSVPFYLQKWILTVGLNNVETNPREQHVGVAIMVFELVPLMLLFFFFSSPSLHSSTPSHCRRPERIQKSVSGSVRERLIEETSIDTSDPSPMFRHRLSDDALRRRRHREHAGHRSPSEVVSGQRERCG